MITITLGVLTTTTQHIKGRPVREYLGVVSGESTAMLFPRRAGIRRGSRAATRTPRRSLQASRDRAIQLMARRAGERGATVVLGVTVEYLSIGAGTLMVLASGTAVRL